GHKSNQRIGVVSPTGRRCLGRDTRNKTVSALYHHRVANYRAKHCHNTVTHNKTSASQFLCA
ncbi:unnamed protein product, partial [Dicrocoelium dendriticum]